MRRRLIKQGMGGLTVSLPIKWIRQRNLKAGDEIDIDEDADRLVLAGIGETSKKKKIYMLHDNKELLRTLLSAYYRQGYYEIILEFHEKQPFKLMQETVESLRGYDIISQEKNLCTIRDMSREEHESSSALTTRLFQQVNLFYDEIRQAVTTGTCEYDLEILRKNIMKNRDYAQRIIKIENKDYSYELYVLVLAIEKISGEYYYLSKHKYPAEKLNQLSKLQELFKEAYNIFNEKNFSKAALFYLKIRKFIAEHNQKNLSSLNGKNMQLCNSEIIILHNLFTIASRLQIITGLFQDNYKDKNAA